jgi:hypothetical protein
VKWSRGALILSLHDAPCYQWSRGDSLASLFHTIEEEIMAYRQLDPSLNKSFPAVLVKGYVFARMKSAFLR